MFNKGFLLRLVWIVLGVIAGAIPAFAAHDVSCYEIINPAVVFLQADSAITPRLGVANHGDHTENNFYVKFLTIEESSMDTTFADSVLITSIAPYDSIEVDIPDWTPEGFCDEEEPFLYFELIGVTDLGMDEDLSNDTTRASPVSLLTHDVGCTDLVLDPEPDAPPDKYYPGTEITFTATVENFGFNPEEHFAVCCEVKDKDSNDVLLWHNCQWVEYINWRGNEEEDSYTVEITFSRYVVQTDHHWVPESYTELEDDMCPDNNICVVHINGPPDDDAVLSTSSDPTGYSLDAVSGITSIGYILSFALPRASWVKLDVFDINGRWVSNIVDDPYEEGVYHVNWDGCDGSGRRAASGSYIIRMQAGDGLRLVRKLVLVD